MKIYETAKTVKIAKWTLSKKVCIYVRKKWFLIFRIVIIFAVY